MKKVFVVGPSGAGKSTFAAELASKLNVPHTELDSIYHQENWVPIDADEFRKIVSEKTDTDGWVLCGNYYSRLGPDYWAKADAIIWLDFSFRLVVSRLVRRTVRRGVRREVLWNGNRESVFRNFFTSDSVIYFMMGKWNIMKQRYEKLFSEPVTPPHVALIKLKTPKEARTFLRNLA